MNLEEDLTPEQLEDFTVHYVKTIDEALKYSLRALSTPLPFPTTMTRDN